MALRNYAYDYENLKKTEKEQEPKIKLIKNKKIITSKKTKTSRFSLVFTTFCVFSMLIIISYRYNIISEKNLMLQRLQIKQVEANALLTTAEVEYNKNLDISGIEAYAKQQLGMQEPEKSQMVYLGSDYDRKIVVSDNQGSFSNIINDIKQKISEIF